MSVKNILGIIDIIGHPILLRNCFNILNMIKFVMKKNLAMLQFNVAFADREQNMCTVSEIFEIYITQGDGSIVRYR